MGLKLYWIRPTSVPIFRSESNFLRLSEFRFGFEPQEKLSMGLVRVGLGLWSSDPYLTQSLCLNPFNIYTR